MCSFMRVGIGMVAIPILPKDRPCESCNMPISAPTWTESSENWIHFVWQCGKCHTQFQTTAIYDLLQRRWMEG